MSAWLPDSEVKLALKGVTSLGLRLEVFISCYVSMRLLFLCPHFLGVCFHHWPSSADPVLQSGQCSRISGVENKSYTLLHLWVTLDNIHRRWVVLLFYFVYFVYFVDSEGTSRIGACPIWSANLFFMNKHTEKKKKRYRKCICNSSTRV